MRDQVRISIVTRRTFLVAAAAALSAKPLLALAEDSAAGPLERSAQFKDAYEPLVGIATPHETGVTVELPEIAENGNFVPITISVDNPMTADNYVKTIHILSTANPVARIATFHLSPANGLARVQSRIRLAKTQDVIVISENVSTSLSIASVLVKVTIGGCSG